MGRGRRREGCSGSAAAAGVDEKSGDGVRDGVGDGVERSDNCGQVPECVASLFVVEHDLEDDAQAGGVPSPFPCCVVIAASISDPPRSSRHRSAEDTSLW